MDKLASIHLKEMYRIIRYVLSTRNHGLKFKPTERWSWLIKACSDSNYASDKGTRRSIYGYFVYFGGVAIAWKSKGMRSVVLSTTEAEYIAQSEVVKELKFVIQLLETMNITVETSIIIYVDIMVAIWLSNN